MKSGSVRKSILMIMMALAVVFGGVVTASEKVSASGITTASIDAVCKQYGYYNGKFWTYGKYDGKTYSTSSPRRNNGYVASNIKGYHGSNTDRNWNGYVYYSQEECHGFACFVMHCVTNTTVIPRDVNVGSSKNGWTKLGASSVSCLKIGDIVRSNGHSAIVYKDLGNGNFQFLQVWGGANKTPTWGNDAINYGKFSASSSCQASNLKELKRIGITYIYRYKDNINPTPVIQHKTGTYKVGSTFAGMTEGRVVREAKNDKSAIKVKCEANSLVYVKETYPNDNWAKVEYKINNKPYSGYMWIASKANKQALDFVSANDITPKAITTTPVVNVSSDKMVAKGKSVSFNWGAVANATKYTVTLKQGSTTVANQTITGTSWSYTLNAVGTYSFTVQAKNDVFWSAVSSAVSVQAFQNVKVTFKDYDGKVLSEQTISYGGNAKQPVNPTGRVGYTFRGWDKNCQNIKADTVITALYDINKYSVRFYDGNGKQIGNAQTIEHGKAAIAPENDSVAVKSGYSFVKWDKQFDNITQNTNVYAVTTWENPNLPIKILDGSTALQQVEDGLVASYKVDMKLRNINTEDTTGRAIVALKTSDGNLLTATESNAFTVKNGIDSDVSVTVPYTGQATRAEIYIVNGYQYTSNNFEIGTIPISEKVSIACERYENSLAVSEWSTEKPPADAVGVETKTQYSSRPISNSVTYKHIYYPNNWSSYTTTVLTGSNTRKVTSKKQYQYRDVGAWGSEQSTTSKPAEGTLLTITGSSTAYYYYHYCNVYVNGSAGVDSVASGSGNGDTIKKNYGKCVYKRSSALTSTANYGDIGGKTQYIVSTGCTNLSGVTSHSGNCGNPGWKLWYFDKSVTTYKYKTRSWGSYSAWQDAAVSSSSTRQVNTRTVYAYKDAAIFYDNNPTGVARSGYTYDSSSVSETNKIYGTWSAWQDEAVTANASTDVQTRTVYRWKTKEEITSGDVIDGNDKIVKGNVPNEFIGREAILFVYKDNDASDYTTEYLGQTKIGEEGNYYFEFMTREEPSKETGDFSATLGIEGTDIVFKLDESNYGDPNQFKAPLLEYTVEFVDKEGKLLTTQKVREGEAAVLPEEIPEVEGYTFVGWNTDVAHIKSDYTIEDDNPIRAEYEINKYDVIYIDWSTNQIETKTYDYGSALTAPDSLSVSSSKEGYEKKWSASFDGNVFVTKDMIVTGEEDIKKFNVTYHDLDNEVFASEVVTYGEKIILPDYNSLSTESIIVVGWKTDDESLLQKVTSDVDIYPDYMYYDSVGTPTVNVESGTYNEKQSIIFEAENVDDDIYYTLDGSDPKENGILFNYPISIDKTTKIRAVAKRDGANDSFETTYYYVINNTEDNGSNWCLYEELPEEVVSNQERYSLESETGYRYSITKQVMSDEEATALAQSGWTQVGETAYTGWTDYMDEIPDGIGEAEIEEKTEEDGTKQYRYRYAIWSFKGYTPWQTDVPNVVNYESETVYRYHSPKQCLLTVSAYGEDDKTMFVYSGEKIDFNPADYLQDGEVFKGLYRNDEYTEEWKLDEDIINEDTVLYLDKERKVCKVSYYGFDDSLITEKEVYFGEDAEDIEPPVVDGYVFTGWDKELTGIKQDTEFHAKYIEAAAARNLSLNLSKKSVFTQSSFNLSASVEGEDAVTDIDWSSANDNIATVEDGVVTGKHAGKTTITAKLSTGERATCDVTVVGDEEYELLLKQVSELTVNREKNIITLSSPMKVSSIKNEFVNVVQAFDDSDTELEDEEVITTNCTINGATVNDKLSVVVLGDLNADKSVDDSDIEVMHNIVYLGLDESDVGTAVYMAADLNQDGIVSNDDIDAFETLLEVKYSVVIEIMNDEYGEASGEGTYKADTSVTLTAVCKEDGKFIGWFSQEGDLLSDELVYVFDVKADITVVAKFEKADSEQQQNDPDDEQGNPDGKQEESGDQQDDPDSKQEESGDKQDNPDSKQEESGDRQDNTDINKGDDGNKQTIPTDKQEPATDPNSNGTVDDKNKDNNQSNNSTNNTTGQSTDKGSAIADNSNAKTNSDNEVKVVTPGKVKIASVKNNKSKAIKIVWKKVKDCKGYEVQYAVNKKFTKSKKNKLTTKLTLSAKKLKVGKTYYVRVRAYNTDTNDNKYYGKWSIVKKVKIKR